MLNIPAFQSRKNDPYDGKPYILLVELKYADTGGGVGGVDPLYIRYARYDIDVIFEGKTWKAFGMGNPARSQSSRGEIPTFDLALANVGREVQSILSNYVVEDRVGRLVTVHVDLLADPSAKHEEPFTVISANANTQHAVLSCAQVKFDPLNVQIPRRVMTRRDYPGLPGYRARYTF